MIQRILHIAFAFLVLLSSTGVIFNKHYCRNELKSLALFVKAKACHPEKSMKSCPMHSSGEQQEKGCCENEAEYVKYENQQISPSFDVEVELSPTLQADVIHDSSLGLVSLDGRSTYFLNYKPPLIVSDLHLDLQTFRC